MHSSRFSAMLPLFRYLVCAAVLVTIISAQSVPIAINLAHRGSDSTHRRTNSRFHKDVKDIMRKYTSIFAAYEKNHGKRHPLQLPNTISRKRSVADLDLLDTGSEAEWLGQMSYGNQTFYIQFDTGSSDTLVNPCAYNHRKSSTSIVTHDTFKISYEDGTAAEGHIYLDMLEIAGIKAKDVAIGVSQKKFTRPFERPSSGISGLGYPGIQTFPKKYKPFFMELRTRKL